ncbi:hypothetical protein Tco_0361751, partial [Tanacetum coccineum]
MKMEYWIQNADHNLWRIVQENKVRTLLLQALPEDHMPDFHHYDDARDIWMAVKARFGGNEESKKKNFSMRFLLMCPRRQCHKRVESKSSLAL